MEDLNIAAGFEDITDLSDLTYADTLEYRVKHPVSGAETTWVWTIAGPAHPVAVALAEKIERRDQEEESKFTQARIAAAKANKPEPKRPNSSYSERAARNAADLAGRVLHFTPIKMNGETIEYSPESTVKLLADQSKDWLFGQIWNAVNSKLGFIKNSAGT